MIYEADRPSFKFQDLVIGQYDQVITELRNYFLPLVSNLSYGYYILSKAYEARQACPTLDQYLTTNNLNLTTTDVYKIRPNINQKIHVDYLEPRLGSLWNLENCESSIVEVYEPLPYENPVEEFPNPNAPTVPWYYYTPEQCTLFGSYDLTVPKYFNPGYAYKVVNNSTQGAIFLKLGCWPDPWNLVNL